MEENNTQEKEHCECKENCGCGYGCDCGNIESADSKMLNKIYQNCQLGTRGTRMLYDKVKSAPFREALRKMEMKYDEFLGKAKIRMDSLGEHPSDANAMVKTMQWIGIQKNTLLECSNRKIAEMLIRGCTNGINDMIESIHDCPEAGEESRKIAEELMHLEEHHINSLKVFLTY